MARYWTQEEVQQLKDLWGEKTIPQIAKALGRSEDAVKVKSTRLKLGAMKDGGIYLNARQTSRLLNVDVHTVIDNWVLKCDLKARKLAPNGERKFTFIRFDNLVIWLKNNQDKWDSRKVELYALGGEPEWLKKKRKEDAKLPKRRFQKWTRQEDMNLCHLFYNKQLSYNQISSTLGRSKVAVQHRLKRVIDKGRVQCSKMEEL